MATGLIDIMKRAAMDANENAQPTDLRYGTVVSVNPLKVQVTNLLTLPQSILVVPEHLTDHKIEVSISPDYGWKTQTKSGGSGEESFSSHDHDITITKLNLFVHGALKVGDKVALIKKSGGQSYFIIDRVEDA